MDLEQSRLQSRQTWQSGPEGTKAVRAGWKTWTYANSTQSRLENLDLRQQHSKQAAKPGAKARGDKGSQGRLENLDLR